MPRGSRATKAAGTRARNLVQVALSGKQQTPAAVTRRRAAALGFDLARLWFETGAVMALRISALSLNALTEREASRMWQEKPAAFAMAGLAAALAAQRMLLVWPHDAMRMAGAASQAWTRSITTEASANRRRLLAPSRRLS